MRALFSIAIAFMAVESTSAIKLKEASVAAEPKKLVFDLPPIALDT